MLKVCIQCGSDISHKIASSLYCDAKCASSYHTARRAAQARATRASRSCEVCGRSLEHRRSTRAVVCGQECYKIRVALRRTPPEKRKPGSDFCVNCGIKMERRARRYYCSTDCRRRHRWVRRLDARQLRECANPHCRKLHKAPKLAECCSDDCRSIVAKYRAYGKGAGESQAIHKGMLKACRVQFLPCRDCETLVAAQVHATGKCCAQCRKRRANDQASRKNHARRALGITLTVHEIAERDGCACHICGKRVNMNLSGMAKFGPTIEHITPVSLGGDNSPDNVALAHRYCNVSRGNRGSSQMLLVS